MGGKAPPTKHARVRCREGEQAPHAPHVQVGAEKTRGQPQAWALEILPLNTQDETEITAVTGARRAGRSRAIDPRTHVIESSPLFTLATNATRFAREGVRCTVNFASSLTVCVCVCVRVAARDGCACTFGMGRIERMRVGSAPHLATAASAAITECTHRLLATAHIA